MLKVHSIPNRNRAQDAPAAAQVLELELGQPLPVITAFNEQTQTRYQNVLCLVRLHSQPLGVVYLPLHSDTLQPEEYLPSLWRVCKTSILEHLRQDNLPPISELTDSGLPSITSAPCVQARDALLTHAPFISVVIATRERPVSLARCIDSLLALQYPAYEIIVVDNAPQTDATRELVLQTYQYAPNLRYVLEERPGISWARNRGIAEARGSLLAFTDDDVVVDKYWLLELVKAFNRSPDVACVTGFTFPLELDTPTQLWFEAVSWVSSDAGVNMRFKPRLLSQKTRYQQLYRGSYCGHGANMAAKADFLRSIGGFDVSLGTGTPTMGGEDLAFFLHVIMHKKLIAYEPGALVHHSHRRDYEKLRKQMFGYGVGFIAYLMHMLFLYPVLWFDLVVKVPFDLVSVWLGRAYMYCLSRLAKKRRAEINTVAEFKDITIYPGELSYTRFKGLFYGPAAYIKSRRLAFRTLRQ